MRIEEVRVSGFRAIDDLTIKMDPFTALIGANGTGKSAVLHALHWFFNGVRGDDFDFRRDHDGGVRESFSVTVKFTELTPDEGRTWARYTRGSILELRRTARPSQADRLSGLVRQGPGFAEVRSAARAPERNQRYQQLRHEVAGLPRATNQVDINAALDAWERANPSALVEVPDQDVAHAFGFHGRNLLADAMRFVLVPASERLEDNAEASGKSGAIAQLVGTVVKGAADDLIARWMSEHSQEFEDLGRQISESVEAAAASHTRETNKFLAEMIRGAELSVRADPLPPRVQPGVDVTTAFTFEGSTMPLAKQGHGVQRSVMVAALQAAASVASSTARRVLLAIEEPELYQHPARSMALARSLRRLAETEQWQVVIATHSPHLLRPESAAAIRRFRKVAGAVNVREGSIDRFASAARLDPVIIQKHLETLLPGDFSAAFFADRVVLAEGVTDVLTIRRIAELQGMDVDTNNWAVVDCGGKGNLGVAAAILTELGVDVRVFFDGDARGDVHDARHQRETSELLTRLDHLGLLGAGESYTFGAPSVVLDRIGICRTAIEDELRHWSSYVASIRPLTGTDSTKNPYLVRVGLADAKVEDCPSFLSTVTNLFREESSADL